MKRSFLWATAGLFLAPVPAHAGMPSLVLSDLASTRLQNISFFIALLLLVAYVVQRLWNFYRKDFPRLPEIDYKKSLGLVVLWGLAFHLVLGMITGARELMTPKAWERNGVTYRLSGENPIGESGGGILLGKMRLERLNALKDALWRYAATHEGRFPPDDRVAEIPGDAWKVFQESNLRYHYITGQQVREETHPLVYEPGVYGDERFVMLVNGNIRHMHIDHIQGMLNDRLRSQ